jgi:hypothetical protein
MEPYALTSPVKLPYRVAHFYRIALRRSVKTRFLNDKEETGADSTTSGFPFSLDLTIRREIYPSQIGFTNLSSQVLGSSRNS